MEKYISLSFTSKDVKLTVNGQNLRGHQMGMTIVAKKFCL